MVLGNRAPPLMNKQDLIAEACQYIRDSQGNRLSGQIAISDEVIGLKLYEEPIFAFGSADDEYFELFKDPAIIGKHFLPPREWLPGAKTVIAFFLPFSQAVKAGNRRDMSWPSAEWLHGRIEGQALLDDLCRHLNSVIIRAGYRCIVPHLDDRFWSNTEPSDDAACPEKAFSSNWSERHVAFVCGLGTFSLSKGLITSKGICGRIGSLVADFPTEPDQRAYTNIDEYCNLCGACVKNCPVKAISFETGKDHKLCSQFLNETKAKYTPRFGCGKCQVAVSCESGIPRSKILPG